MRILTLCLSSLLLLTACSRDAAIKPAKLQSFDASRAIEIQWKNKVKIHTPSSGLSLGLGLSEHYVAYNDDRGVLGILSRNKGVKLWAIEMRGIKFAATPWVDKKTLYTVTDKGMAMGIDLDTADVIWKMQLGTQVYTQPAGDDKTVVFRGHHGHLMALDRHSGRLKWKFKTKMPKESLQMDPAPLIHNGVVYAGFDNGHVVALNAHSGEVIWDKPVASSAGYAKQSPVNIVDITAQLAIDHDVLYATSFSGQAMALSIDTGKVLWQQSVGHVIGLAAGEHLVFMTDTSSHLSAYDKKTGALVWKQVLLDHRTIGDPVVSKQFVAVTDQSGYLHWFSAYDGHIVARHYLKGATVLGQPVGYDHTVYVMTKTGYVEALKLAK